MWYKKRFGVELDPETEIHSLIGSKEGIGHLSLAFAEPGRVVLCPEPAYPVYRIGTIFAQGEPYLLPLREANSYLPDLEAIPDNIKERASLLFLNYPNNPTTATCDEAFFHRVVSFARKFNIVVAHDGAYTEIYFEGKRPPSFLAVPGAKEVGIEFHSLSKTYSMTGWRIGWVAGNSDIIKELSRIKNNLDSGVFEAVQLAAARALSGPQDCVEETRQIYQERRDILIKGLEAQGFRMKRPMATFYVWAKVPPGYTSASCVERMLEEAGIVATPGIGMGPSGEGYVRFSLTVPKVRIEEAIERLKKIRW